ncbi:peptidoglycan-binding domain-containing protein [Streptomyces sp. NPDC055189]
MNFRTTRGRTATAAMGALAAATLTISATPASAAASDGYIRGAGSIYDDLGDEGTLSTSSYARSNLACFWQNVLYAEGATEANGTVIDRSDIDGAFGGNTKFATRTLQKRWGLTTDGMVGNNTFGKLDEKRVYHPDADGSGVYSGKLQYLSTDSVTGQIKAKYHGKLHSFNIYRNGTNGRWSFVVLKNDNGSIVPTHYNDTWSHCTS